MKNTKLFPFERNKYFYGKLLSVDDFELEQDYMNNKRRMLNRYLNGCGVVAGLHVVGLDEQTISVEAGIALDATGRELVMDVPVVKKLSMLDGFGACRSRQDRPYIYLCLEYGETETDRVHNVTKNARPERDGEDVDYNKIREGCRLYLTDREPELENMSPSAMYEDVKTVYWKDGVRICQIMPRWQEMRSRLRVWRARTSRYPAPTRSRPWFSPWWARWTRFTLPRTTPSRRE